MNPRTIVLPDDDADLDADWSGLGPVPPHLIGRADRLALDEDLERSESREPALRMLDHALVYAHHGWPVFPCKPDGDDAKKPFTDHGFKDATVDEGQIRRWWGTWPNALIGAPMGPHTGAFAIDPDMPKKPGDPNGVEIWDALSAEHGGVPQGRCHHTPRGGKHLLFKYPLDRKIGNREGGLAGKNINVRGDGGYVILPPSRLSDGRSYTLVDVSSEWSLPPAPRWLLDLIAAKPSQQKKGMRDAGRNGLNVSSNGADTRLARYIAAAVEKECSAVAECSEGHRNNQLNASAFALGRLAGAEAFDIDATKSRLFAAAEQCGLVADETPDDVAALINRALADGARPENARDLSALHRPVIEIKGGDIATIADAAEAALLAAGAPVYQRGGKLVRPVEEEVEASRGRTTVAVQLKDITIPALTDMLARIVDFQRFDARSRRLVSIDPPRLVAEVILARVGSWTFPRIVGCVTAPTLRPDGSLMEAPGYDAATRLYHFPDPTMRLPDMSNAPTHAEAKTALDLLDGLLGGFPFVGPTDRAVALSALMTAVLRGAMSAAPMHCIRAHTAGTGKSFLVDLAAMIATGRHCPASSVGDAAEELEKRLAALLLSGAALVSLDNVNGEVGGDMLCQAVERPLVSIRPLGVSEIREVECRSTVFCTGNNTTVCGDMVRRTITCNLDARIEKPELRLFDFDPIERVLADRGGYVGAVLTIARAYRTAGSPKVCGPIASYGDWTTAVRAPLIWLDVADPVASMEAARAEDPELVAIRELFSHWEGTLELGKFLRTSQIDAVSQRHNDQIDVVSDFREFLLRQFGAGGLVNPMRLGRFLSRIHGRVVDGQKLEMRQDKKHGNLFALVEVRVR